jgi:cephalosporin hydroxylase
MAIPLVRPITIVTPDQCVTHVDMAKRILKTFDEHGDLLNAYHKVWYESGHTWHYTQFLGIGLMKSPNDLWMYQTLMAHFKPQTVIETGTYKGASALWFASIMDLLKIDGKVYTIDIEDRRECDHPKIVFIDGDSTNPAVAEAILAEVKGPVLLSLDSDHSSAHVRRELDLWTPACGLEDWCVVEDTNIGWEGPTGDKGAMGGVRDFLLANPGQWRQDVICERWLLTMNPGGWLQKVR